MDEMTQRNAALVEESAAAARSLDEQSVSLTEMMGFFTIDRADHTQRAAPAARPAATARPAPAPVAAPLARPAAAARPAPVARPAAAARPTPGRAPERKDAKPREPARAAASRKLATATAGDGKLSRVPANNDADWKEF
jgi:hypothetical protein